VAWRWSQQGKKTYVKRLWMLGFVGISLASLLDLFALGFAPQSLVAPLGALTMVLNAYVAPCMHGEEVRAIVLFATFVIVTGCVMAVATASHDNTVCSPAALESMYRSYTFLGIILVVLFINGVVLSFARHAKYVRAKHGENVQGVSRPV